MAQDVRLVLESYIVVRKTRVGAARRPDSSQMAVREARMWPRVRSWVLDKEWTMAR